ncbi:general odorant-binding protein 99a [Neocloeon triangulifer]|uniref:general odorant-binding protein 99a n=1 Tax=Neocloeon triangulifer TaxID=2078957 RepID=UPI00286EECF8|nr:general odorant-binding protein 99a [Neocloeon triangulifer]
MRSFAFAAVVCMTLVVASAVIPTERKEKSDKLRAECREEQHVTVEDLEILKTKEYGLQYPEKVQCYLKCVGEKYGLYEDGKLVDAKVETELRADLVDNPTRAQELIEHYGHCKGETGATACETAAKVYNCIITHKH